jgi:hypothetical protein
MTWRQITDEDLLSKMVEAELDAIGDAKDQTIANVVAKVRGYVASAGIDLDADTLAIPERLISDACAVVVVDAYISLGGTLKDSNGERAQAKRDALKLFEAVAAKKYSIADPDSGAESTDAIRPRYIGTRTARRFSRDSQEGL